MLLSWPACNFLVFGAVLMGVLIGTRARLWFYIAMQNCDMLGVLETLAYESDRLWYAGWREVVDGRLCRKCEAAGTCIVCVDGVHLPCVWVRVAALMTIAHAPLAVAITIIHVPYVQRSHPRWWAKSWLICMMVLSLVRKAFLGV